MGNGTDRVIFPVGATAESIRTQIGAVGPAPIPGSVPNPVIGDVPTWNGTTYVPQAGGGSGGYVIPDGGTIEGIYNSDVLCLDSATMTGAVEVRGNLIVLSTLTNTGGYELTVRGMLQVNNLSFNRSDLSQPQGEIIIDGDFIAEQVHWQQTGGESALMRIGGDMIGRAGFSGIYVDAPGVADNQGATIIVYGDSLVGQMNLYGGESALANAGSGGQLIVYGNLTILNQLNLYGGNASTTGFDAGNGGELNVYGSLYAEDQEISLNGGDGYQGNAGPGGQIYVGGHFYVSELQVHGGYCNSDFAGHNSGRGGDVYVGGGFTSRNFVNLNGGERDGTLSSGNMGSRPDGGSFQAYGNVSIDEYTSEGGSIFTTNFSPCPAGNGGYMDVEGNLDAYELDLNGGNSSNGDGDAGSANESYVKGNLVVESLNMRGGDAGNGSAGSGGYFEVDGNAAIDSLYANGGSATNGNGGYGGYFYCQNDVSLNYADLYGGNCNSANESHNARNGGGLEAKTINASDSNLYLDGGDRTGGTTISNTGNNVANGGDINANGDLHCYNVSGDGGTVSTDFPNSAGGTGMSVSVTGNLYCYNSFSTNGGAAVGNNAGRGGNLVVRGTAYIRNFDGDGGAANNSSGVGSDAGTNGAGSDVYFYGGAVLSDHSQLDGNGLGSAPTDFVTLQLGGNCVFRSLSMSDRANTRIMMAEDFPIILKIDLMPGKVTLNDFAGVPTSDISGLLAANLFFAGAGSSAQPWLALTGVGI